MRTVSSLPWYFRFHSPGFSESGKSSNRNVSDTPQAGFRVPETTNAWSKKKAAFSISVRNSICWPDNPNSLRACARINSSTVRPSGCQLYSPCAISPRITVSQWAEASSQAVARMPFNWFWETSLQKSLIYCALELFLGMNGVSPVAAAVAPITFSPFLWYHSRSIWWDKTVGSS